MKTVEHPGDRISILIIDDEKSLLDPLQSYLQDYGYEVDTALNWQEASPLVEKKIEAYDVVLLDQTVRPGPNGLEIMKRIKNRNADTECIIFTAWGNEHRQQALREGAFRYLEKPFVSEELALLIRTAAQQVRLRALSRSMMANQKGEDLLQSIITSARSLAFGDDASIVLFDQKTSRFDIHRSALVTQPHWNRHIRNRCLSKEIMDSGKTISVPDLYENPEEYRELIRSGYFSFVGIPIPGEGENLGVLYVYSSNAHQFDPYGITAILRTMASQAGLAILNTRANEQLSLHNQYMEALVKVSQGLSSTNDLKKQLSLTWDFVRTQLGASTFFIGMHDPVKDELSFPLYYDRGEPIHIESRSLALRSNWGPSGYVVKTGKELFWPTSGHESKVCRPRQISSKIHGGSTECCFFFPLKIDRQVIGLISIQSYTPYGLQDILLDAFRALGNQLSAAMKNTRLFKEEAKRANEANTLRQATAALSSSLDSDQIITTILGEMRQVVPFDYASVQLLHRKNNRDEFVISSSYGFENEKAFLGLPFPADSNNPNREVYRTQKPVIFEDAPALFPGFHEQPHVEASIHGWLGVPMMVGEKMIGMISLDSKERGFFTAYHSELALSFASQAAIAIDNARHHQETERSNRLLKTLDEYVNYIRSDQESQKLKHQTVRLAVNLVGWPAGLLFSYNPRLEVFHLESVHNLPTQLIGTAISTQDGFMGSVAAAGEWQYSASVENLQDLASLIKPYSLQSAVAVPLKYSGEIGWILVLCAPEEKEITEYELEILDSFASQAAAALQISRLFDTENKGYRQLLILKKINEYIEGGKDLYPILHMILTGLTASYGLGLNRASLLGFEGEDALVGRMAIGDIDAKKAELSWQESREQKLDEFSHYWKALESNAVRKTPLEMAVVDTHFPLQPGKMQKLVQAFQSNAYLEGSPETFPELASFLEVFKPASELIIAPIRSGQKVTGLLVADNKFTLAPITEGDKDALLTFANTAAVAVENRRMLQELTLSQDRLLKAQKAAGQVAQVTVLGNLADTLETIRNAAEQVFKCSMFTLYVYNDSRKKFTDCEHFGSLDRKNITPPDKLTRTSVVWQVLDLPEPFYYYTEDTPNDRMLSGNFANLEKVKATLTIKLLYNGTPVGTIFINFRDPHRFTVEEIETAYLFAEQAAIAIQNAQLYDQVNQSREYLECLNEAGKNMSSSLNLQDRLKAIAESARRLSSIRGEMASFCNILLDEGGVLKFEQSSPAGFAPVIDEIRLDAPRVGVIGRAFLENRPVLVPNVNEDEDYIQSNEGTVSELAVPIVLHENPIGVINLESKEPAAFDADDIRALKQLASQASGAIDTSRLYEELEKTMHKVVSRTAVAWMGMSASAWRHSVDKLALKIRFTNKLLQDELKLPPDSQQAGWLASIENLVAQILAKPITPPLATDESVEPVLVNNFIQHRTNRLWDSYPFKSACLEKEFLAGNHITIWASPEWLKRAFDLVVENAAKVLLNYPNPVITVGTRMYGAGKVMITVKDSGPGFPPDVLQMAGKEYIPKRAGQEGMGMGLLLAETIAETFGGELKILSPGPHDTTVAFVFPVYKPVEQG